MTEKQRLDRLRRMFRRIYRGRYSGSNAAADDFAFHMIDAKADFVAFARLLEAPDAMMPKEQRKVVDNMVAHAVNHLVAAARLTGEFLDPFAPTKARRAPRKKTTAAPR